MDTRSGRLSEDERAELRELKDLFNDPTIKNKDVLFARLGKLIQCPVVAIHGDYDPHPYQGVKIPLSRTLNSFSTVIAHIFNKTPGK